MTAEVYLEAFTIIAIIATVKHLLTEVKQKEKAMDNLFFYF